LPATEGPRGSEEGVVTSDLEKTVRAFFADWATRDPDVLAAYFAPDGQWSEPNRAPARGRDEIRSVLELQVGFGSEFEFEFRTIGSFRSTVFTERIDRFIINGSPMVVPVAGLLEFDDAGKIRAWRDYYDWSALERQLIESGVDMSGADHA
jgi:limonene-1,2-epoxide hydrolase